MPLNSTGRDIVAFLVLCVVFGLIFGSVKLIKTKDQTKKYIAFVLSVVGVGLVTWVNRLYENKQQPIIIQILTNIGGLVSMGILMTLLWQFIVQ